MALFILNVQPMITCLQVASTAKQCRFLNDAGGRGYFTEMRQQGMGNTLDPDVGFFPKKKKEVVDYRKAVKDGKCEGSI